MPAAQRARSAALTCRAVATGPARPAAPKDNLDALIAEAIVHPPEQHASNFSDGVPLFAGPDVEVRFITLCAQFSEGVNSFHLS